VGWGAGRTIGGLAASVVLMAAFGVNEQRRRLSAGPDVDLPGSRAWPRPTPPQMIACGRVSTRCLLRHSLYAERPGLLPAADRGLVSAGDRRHRVRLDRGRTKMFVRTGTRPIIVSGALLAAVESCGSPAYRWMAAISVTCSPRWWSMATG